MNRKGQGALEYLLLIGGIILVAALVLAIITGVVSQTETVASGRVADALCASFTVKECTRYEDAGKPTDDVTKTYVKGRDPDGAATQLTADSCLFSVARSRCYGCQKVKGGTGEDKANCTG